VRIRGGYTGWRIASSIVNTSRVNVQDSGQKGFGGILGMSAECACVSVSGPRPIAGGAATPTRPHVHGLFWVCSRFVPPRSPVRTKGEQSTNASVTVT